MTSSDDALLRRGLLLIGAVVVVAYAGLGSVGFVWDDQALIVENPFIRSLSNIPHFFFVDLWDISDAGTESSGYYRPLMSVSLSVDHALFGHEPLGYHMHNLLWHLR